MPQASEPLSGMPTILSELVRRAARRVRDTRLIAGGKRWFSTTTGLRRRSVGGRSRSEAK
jgi:hypothetical protein